jgi:hypothetical protein
VQDKTSSLSDGSSQCLSKQDQQAIKRKASTDTIIQIDLFLDEERILRVGGRLENANIPFSSKHPITPNFKCKLAELIVRHTHEDIMKYGPVQNTICTLRQEFWILHFQKLVKTCIHCNKRILCFRKTAQGS